MWENHKVWPVDGTFGIIRAHRVAECGGRSEWSHAEPPNPHSILLQPPVFFSFSHASPWNHHSSTASPIILGIPWSKHSDAGIQPAKKVQNHPCPGFLNPIKFNRVGGDFCFSPSPSIFPQPPSLRKLVVDASNIWRLYEAHAEPTKLAFVGICQFGARPCWGPMLGSCCADVVPWLSMIEPYWIYLGSFGSDGGPFLGPFYLRAKNDLFFARRSWRNWVWKPMLGSCRAFIGPCWGCLGPWLSYWVYLGPFGSGEGQFLGLFFRAKNHAIFSLEGPMLGSCRAFIGPRWGYLGPWLSLSGSISGPTIGCGRICSWEENLRWVLWVLMIIYWGWLEQRPSLESSGFLYKI